MKTTERAKLSRNSGSIMAGTTDFHIVQIGYGSHAATYNLKFFSGGKTAGVLSRPFPPSSGNLDNVILTPL
jgi:hypothetical protein